MSILKSSVFWRPGLTNSAEYEIKVMQFDSGNWGWTVVNSHGNGVAGEVSFSTEEKAFQAVLHWLNERGITQKGIVPRFINRITNPRFTPEEEKQFSLETVVFTPSVFCPRCGEFDDREPIYRHSFTGEPYEQDWIEGHRCLKCGQMHEYRDGNY